MEKTATTKSKAAKKPASAVAASNDNIAVSEKPKRKPAARKSATPISAEMRERMIADAAYYKAENRGFGNGGDHVDDWFKAEAEIDAMINNKS